MQVNFLLCNFKDSLVHHHDPVVIFGAADVIKLVIWRASHVNPCHFSFRRPVFGELLKILVFVSIDALVKTEHANLRTELNDQAHHNSLVGNNPVEDCCLHDFVNRKFTFIFEVDLAAHNPQGFFLCLEECVFRVNWPCEGPIHHQSNSVAARGTHQEENLVVVWL